MRTALLIGIAVVAIGCEGKSNVPVVDPRTSRQEESEVIAYVDLRSPERLVKRFVTEPDPAYGAESPASCRKAGGEWSDFYDLGVLILREPQEGAKRAGKRCWSKRQPTKLADAGKPCSGQADCIGNCIAMSQDDGTWSRPKCQINAEDDICGPLYDGGQYYWIECPIP